MAGILTPQVLRRLEQFQLIAARRANSSAKGERKSRARGQSVEFVRSIQCQCCESIAVGPDDQSVCHGCCLLVCSFLGVVNQNVTT